MISIIRLPLSSSPSKKSTIKKKLIAINWPQKGTPKRGNSTWNKSICAKKKASYWILS